MAIEDDHYTDETEVSCVLGDDAFVSGEDAIDVPKMPLKPQEESLLLRRRRVERLMDAKRLSKQLFDFDEKQEDHSYYDDDLFDISEDDISSAHV